MENIQNRYRWLELSEDAHRQYVDAQAVLTAFETAKKAAAEVRGGMHWKAQRGAEYLIRTSVSNEQRSLGSRSPETEEIYNKFIKRKDQVESRLTDLKEELERQRKMNRALNVGRAPKILVDILNTLSKVGLAEYFIVIGTHSLYAYEAAAGVRIRESNAMTTRDIDLLWDTRKRLSFVTNMSAIGSTFLEVLQKVDSTFEIMPDQLYTAVNSKGFEIDIIRRPHTDDEPHPLRLTDHEDDLFAVEAKQAGVLLAGERFSSMIVSTSGHMARMQTISPVVFTKLKRWLGEQEDRDLMKRDRDILQAGIVEDLVTEFLPHLLTSRVVAEGE